MDTSSISPQICYFINALLEYLYLAINSIGDTMHQRYVTEWKEICLITSNVLKIISSTRKSVDGEPSHIPALIKANRIEASYFP